MMGWKFYCDVSKHTVIWDLVPSLTIARFTGQFSIALSWLCWSVDSTWVKEPDA